MPRLTLDETAILEGRLKAANGRRGFGRVTIEQVISMIADVDRRPGSWAYVLGDKVGKEYDHPVASTVAVAVRRTDGAIAVDIIRSFARTVTVNHMWPDIQEPVDKYTRLTWSENRKRIVLEVEASQEGGNHVVAQR